VKRDGVYVPFRVDDSGRQVPALIAVFKPAGTAVALQRGTTVFGLTVIRNSDER
jgi:hypothetical protein